MQIESIEIKSYRLFRAAELRNLPRLTIVVGANGSGKSTLFDVFTFLKDALTQNVSSAVARRGGYRELVSRGQLGPISMVVKFRESGGKLATYQLEIAEDAGKPVVHREVLEFRRGQYGQPWHFVDPRLSGTGARSGSPQSGHGDRDRAPRTRRGAPREGSSRVFRKAWSSGREL